MKKNKHRDGSEAAASGVASIVAQLKAVWAKIKAFLEKCNPRS